jgi:hypothetical protein
LMELLDCVAAGAPKRERAIFLAGDIGLELMVDDIAEKCEPNGLKFAAKRHTRHRN